MANNPDLFEIGCVGRIAHSQERPDGTFQILLVGEQRFRVLAEHPRSGDRLYRTARVDLLVDPEPETPEDQQSFSDSKTIVLDLLERVLDLAEHDQSTESVLQGFAQLEPARMINALTQSISFVPAERQQLLEADSILSRFEIMVDLLRFRIAESNLTQSDPRQLPN